MTIRGGLLRVLLWVCLLHPCLTAMVFTRTNDHQPTSLMAHGAGSDGKTLHRQKRGWMWNQFFLLEEYTGSDYQYVGKVGLMCPSYPCSHVLQYWMVEKKLFFKETFRAAEHFVLLLIYIDIVVLKCACVCISSQVREEACRLTC